MEIERTNIAFLCFHRLGFANHLYKIFASGGRPCSPDDVAVLWLVPLLTKVLLPCGNELVPLPLGADSQGFKIPTILAVLSERQFRPKRRSNG